MDQIFDLMIISLLASIVIGTYLVIEVLKSIGKKLTQFQKKLVTLIIGIIFSFVWHFGLGEERLDILVLTFLAAVGFYDFIIKTILDRFPKKEENGNSENNTGTR